MTDVTASGLHFSIVNDVFDTAKECIFLAVLFSLFSNDEPYDLCSFQVAPQVLVNLKSEQMGQNHSMVRITFY